MGQSLTFGRIRPADAPGTLQDGAAAERIIAQLATTAAAEEAGTADIAASVNLLRQMDWLGDDGVSHPALSADRLRRVGAVNLPVGRLFEGHMNALCLARAHGSPRAQVEVRSMVAGGAFLGVWGADGAAPVAPSGDGCTLSGHKTFASGLGTVTHAVVTVSSGPQVRLGLVGVGDAGRGDASTWTMQGMRATASGRYDLDGVPIGNILWLGGPGDYLTEPHFVGGVWRIAALQIGGAIGLLEAAASALRSQGRLDAPAQMARLSVVAIRALAASALVTRAALAAAPGAPQSPDAAAALSAASRLVTEEVGLDAIRAVEQSLGLQHFDEGSLTGRRARDLAVYLRQAARDAFQTRVGEACFAKEDGLWKLL